jgi:hypothetical protein
MTSTPHASSVLFGGDTVAARKITMDSSTDTGRLNQT